MDVRTAIAEVVAGRGLAEGQAEALFGELLGGRLEEAGIAGLLAAVQARVTEDGRERFRGATVDELVGAARVMRRHVTRVPFEAGAGEVVLDTCGTGGAAKLFNVSTAAAIVAAAAQPDERVSGVKRVVVAKHGNRSRTGRGSAEVLAALGVNVDASVEVQARCLRECGVCFCFAIHHHPAMRFAAGARKAVGGATMFNVLGPLTNPAGARHQVIGVYEQSLVSRVAGALARLGAEGAMVVHGVDAEGGMDEMGVTGETVVGVVGKAKGSKRQAQSSNDGGEDRVEMGVVRARELGVGVGSRVGLVAADVGESAAMVRGALTAGSDDAAARIVRMNAAAGLLVCGAAAGMEQGLELAREAVESGRALRVLEELRTLSRESA